MNSIYLDFAAATPVDKKVLEAMKPYFADAFYNPSATYLAAKGVKHVVEDARSSVARSLGAKPSEIIFTAGGTEANNLAINGVMSQFPDAKLLVSAIEHDSVLEVAKNHNVQKVPVDKLGITMRAELEKAIDDSTMLISVMYVNNEIGSIQPLRDIVQLVQKIRRNRTKRNISLPLYIHTDAAQAANYLDLHVSRLGVDLMTLNGGKIYGPKQSGALFVKTGVKLSPQIVGGGQERSLRSGTENVPGIVGFSCALTAAQKIAKSESARLTSLRDYFISQIQKLFPGAIINGSRKHRVANNVHVTFPGLDNERLMMQLDELGIQCAVGSACSASSDEPSHVLTAIGLSDTDIQASLRFTLGRTTTQKQIDTTLRTLQKIMS